MSWLTDDPDVLNFVIDAVDTWTESDLETTSSDDVSDATPTTETITMAPVFGGERKKKRRIRANRRQEILGLREEASSLTSTLKELQNSKTKPEVTSSRAKWERQARRELSSRRQAELTNAWLRATLARHVKNSRRLSRLLHQLKNTPTEPPVFDYDGLVLNAPSETVEEQTPVVTMVIHDLSDTVVIEITGEWQYQGCSAASLETAVWTLFSADHLRVTEFAIEYVVQNDVSEATSSPDGGEDAPIVSNNGTSIHGSFTIHSTDGSKFQGRQLWRCRREETSGELVVSVTGQTLPLSVCQTDLFADVTLLEEESHFRVRQEWSEAASALLLDRRFRLHAAEASDDHRLEIARVIGCHFQSEMKWMHDEVERRAAKNRDDSQLLFPLQETTEAAKCERVCVVSQGVGSLKW